MTPTRTFPVAHRVCTQCAKQNDVQRRAYTATTTQRYAAETSRLPRVANPSLWTSMVPRFLRRPTSEEEAAERAKRRDAVGTEERRTGLIFLFLGILVGSNAINIIQIRREMLNFTRQTNARLDLLREVVQRVKNGEEFDVKKALGTGDLEQEKEWDQVMQELENTDTLWDSRKKRDAERAAKAEEKKLKDEERRNARKTPKEPTSSDPTPKTARPKFLM